MRAPAAAQPQLAARAIRADPAWSAAARADGGTRLGRIAATLVRGSTSCELHALILVLRDELAVTDARALLRQLGQARKRHWLYEHRLAIALAVFGSADEQIAHQVLVDDGIPLEAVLEAAAELRAARAREKARP